MLHSSSPGCPTFSISALSAGFLLFLAVGLAPLSLRHDLWPAHHQCNRKRIRWSTPRKSRQHQLLQSSVE